MAAIEGAQSGPIVLDEIHKDRRWKNRLKGVYDTVGDSLPIIVTGSARLDLFKKGGDSLMGRYLPYHIHPITVAEANKQQTDEQQRIEKTFHPIKPEHSWSDLLKLGGFPEPYLGASEGKAKRWSRLRLERFVREDVRDLRAISDLNALQLLVDFLPERVGAPLSINSLREDVGVAYATVRDWMQVLESLYFCFFIKPWSKSIKRSLLSEPKMYLFDILQIQNEGARLENLAALHLLKACDYWTDTAVGEFRLHYLRTKEKKEVDFLVVKDGKPWVLIECKSSDSQISESLAEYARHLKVEKAFQLVNKKGFYRKSPGTGIEVISYESFFSSWV